MDIAQVRGHMKWCALFLVLRVEIHTSIYFTRKQQKQQQQQKNITVFNIHVMFP